MIFFLLVILHEDSKHFQPLTELRAFSLLVVIAVFLSTLSLNFTLLVSDSDEVIENDGVPKTLEHI
jgi:hypothetical protein